MRSPLPRDPAQEAYRTLGRAIAAGLIAGVLVGGIGGRIVMRISAIAADSDGLLTDSGNRVGDITVGGTLALVVFGGLFAGLAGGIGVFAARPWLPEQPLRRALLLAALLPLMIGTTVISAENPDFLVLDPPELNIALFAGLFAAFGLVVVAAEGLVDRLLPETRQPRPADEGRAVAAAVLMVPIAIVSLLLLVDRSTYLVGVFFLPMGAATTLRMVGPLEGLVPDRIHGAVSYVGYGSLIGACVAGSWHAALEIEAIL